MTANSVVLCDTTNADSHVLHTCIPLNLGSFFYCMFQKEIMNIKLWDMFFYLITGKRFVFLLYFLHFYGHQYICTIQKFQKTDSDCDVRDSNGLYILAHRVLSFWIYKILQGKDN